MVHGFLLSKWDLLVMLFMTRFLRLRLVIGSAVVLATWAYVWTLNHVGMTYLNQERMLAIRMLEVFLVLQWLMLAVPALGIWLAFQPTQCRRKLLHYLAPELFFACALLWAMTAHAVWLVQTTSHYGPLKHWRMLQQERMMQNSPAAESKVSIAELLQNKERWRGRMVEVRGFFVSRFEARALYQNEADSKGMRDDRSLWVDFPDKTTTDKGKLKWVRRGFVRIIGQFDFQTDKGCGHLGRWPARLRNIEMVETISAPGEPPPAPAPR